MSAPSSTPSSAPGSTPSSTRDVGAAPAPRLLSARGRAWRVALAGLLAVGYLAGSFVGDDPWWPLGPWRMYSTSSAPGGSVSVFALQITTADDPVWRDTPIGLRNVGLNRAELEGRSELVLSDPAVLGTLAEAHARLEPDDEPWTGVRLLRRSTVLEDRSPTGEVRVEPLAQWTAGAGGQLL